MRRHSDCANSNPNRDNSLSSFAVCAAQRAGAAAGALPVYPYGATGHGGELRQRDVRHHRMRSVPAMRRGDDAVPKAAVLHHRRPHTGAALPLPYPERGDSHCDWCGCAVPAAAAPGHGDVPVQPRLVRRVSHHLHADRPHRSAARGRPASARSAAHLPRLPRTNPATAAIPAPPRFPPQATRCGTACTAEAAPRSSRSARASSAWIVRSTACSCPAPMRSPVPDARRGSNTARSAGSRLPRASR